MTIEYNNVMTDDNLSVEISTSELSELVSLISKLGLEGFIKGLMNSSKDEEQADTEEPEEKRDLLIKCRSVKSKIYPERFVLVKQYLKHQNIDYEISARDSDEIIYYLTGRQMEELMAHLNRNECSTNALI